MFGWRRDEKDFSAELEAHIVEESARLQAEGMAAADADAAAWRAFGNLASAVERSYERGRWVWWDELRKDFRYALRTLRQNPVFTAAAILTLALGIGANTAIYSIIDAALVRPLPYPDAHRILMLHMMPEPDDPSTLSPAGFLDYRRMASSFSALSAFRETPLNVPGIDRPERVNGADVTPDFFAVMGVDAQIGRTLNAQADPPGGGRTVILSHAFWTRRYAARADVLGQVLLVDGEPTVIAGVMPPSFNYPPGVQLWTSAKFAVPAHPLRPFFDQSHERDTHYFNTVVRLKQGVAPAQAQAEVDTIAMRLKAQYGTSEEAGHAAMVTIQSDLVGETKPALLVLLGAVALLMLIACANVANILLARGATRQKEIAIRTALGAGRGRLLRQFLTESLTLGVAGGVAGIVIAYLARRPIQALVPEGLMSGTALELDARVLAFTAAVSLGSAILFGIVPALQAAGFDLNALLKEGIRGSSGTSAGRTRSLLVIAEIALAGVLLIGAGLLLRSFNRLLAVPEGFETDHILSLQLSLPNAVYPQNENRANFVRQVLERANAIPGVSGSAAISRLPLSPGNSTRSVDVKGRATPPDGGISPDYLVVTPEYFRVMGIRLAKGRFFTERDDAQATPVVMINQAMARLVWPGEDALGQMITVGVCTNGKTNEWCEVVGIVDDVHQHGLDQKARPAVYIPYARDPWPMMAFVVRTRTEPGAAASALEAAIHDVDRNQAVYNVRPMNEVVSVSLSPRRLKMLLIGLFALLALGLACAGIYGVMAYTVVQRTQEIGIRMALGAGRSDVLRLIGGQALRLSLAGMAAGALLSFALTRFLGSMLYGVKPTDAATFAGVSTLLIATALTASLLPAVKATRVDPVTSLRAQ